MNSRNPTGHQVSRLSSLIEVLPDAVFFKDAEGRWQVINEQAIRLFGFHDGEWFGKTDLELAADFPQHAATLIQCHANDELAWQAGWRTDTEESVRNPANGELLHFEVARIPLFNPDGSRRGMVVAGTDISARRAAETVERRQRDSLRRLGELSAHTHQPLDTQFREVLRAGIEQLDLDFAIISEIVDDRYTILAQQSPHDQLHVGQAFTLGATYCALTLEQDGVVAVEHMAKSPWHGHPCYQAFALEAYIGAPIRVDGRIFGTVSFSSPKPYPRRFDEADREFVALLARCAGAAIENDRMAKRLAESELKWRTIVDNEPDCVKLLDRSGCVLQMNPAGLAMLQADQPEQVVGQPVLPLIASEHRTVFADLLERCFNGESGRLEFQVDTLKGQQRWLETHAVPMRDTSGRITGQLSITRDISRRKRIESEIHHLAFFDELTDLPNRRLLIDRLNHALNRARRQKSPLAVLFIDLDHFKEVNDQHGHDVGDQLLREVARRMKQCVRAGDTVARQGGDEFIILAETALPDDARVIAEKIVRSLAAPFAIEALNLTISPSVGIAIYPIDGTDDTMELLKKADIAMYAAKHAGRNTFRFFTETPPRATRPACA